MSIAVAPGSALEARLLRGAEMLWELEQRGETGEDYARWLALWLDLLHQYESSEVD